MSAADFLLYFDIFAADLMSNENQTVTGVRFFLALA